MACEESMEIPMIIDEIEPQSGEVQSIVKTEIIDPPKNRKKILPRYLSASLGSCHDFCKFGIKHGSEAEERIPLRIFLKARRNEQRIIQADSETKKKDALLNKSVSLKEGLSVKKSPLLRGKSFDTRNVKKSEEGSTNSRGMSLNVDEDVLEKTVYVIESTIENTNSKPTQDDSLTRAKPSQPARKVWRPKVKSQPSLSSEKNGLRRMKIEAHSKVSPLENGVSSSENQPKATNQRRKKKIVTPKAEGKIVTKFERKNRGTLISESKTDLAQKLKFRRGTILDPKPENIPAPRRLKFRRAKILGEGQNGKDDNQRVSFNTKVVPVNNHMVGTKPKPEKPVSRNYQNAKRVATKRIPRRNQTGSGEGVSVIESPTLKVYKKREIVGGDHINETSTEKVVLRHQNLAGKKKVRSLFNNVIKETASKLVEARKSKVKALVGAFETVISLQDAKGKTRDRD